MNENLPAIEAWLKGELLSGKKLILPSQLYDKAIPLLLESGWSEEVIKNIHKTQFLPANPAGRTASQ